MNTLGKPRKPYLRVDWKLSLPAHLAGRVDLLLVDPLTGKPKYGARSRLSEQLYEHWLAIIEGRDPPPLPDLQTLREESTA